MTTLLGQVGELTLEHLWLTAFAMALAIAIALPVGIWIAERPRVARWVLGVANVVQTIPSLALFGFLLPLPWLGERAARIAITALCGYALLPILRNTYTGLRTIDPALLDASEALGLDWWQRLRWVRLPLAFLAILAGIRVSTVICIGIATIAAAIGAGGLGELIFRSVASVDNRLVLAGALPAALLALAADALLGAAEKIAARRR